ncbi:hypothetical protein Q5P01_021935 [Channa striata]|uniref:Uncharacterized protein n=1 Tax=Channa striata TaxID=64152 RepID=A0AA88IVC7_CHASR|nr:hypothetical protein Q5P01_021935 [Channa striata]
MVTNTVALLELKTRNNGVLDNATLWRYNTQLWLTWTMFSLTRAGAAEAIQRRLVIIRPRDEHGGDKELHEAHGVQGAARQIPMAELPVSAVAQLPHARLREHEGRDPFEFEARDGGEKAERRGPERPVLQEHDVPTRRRPGYLDCRELEEDRSLLVAPDPRGSGGARGVLGPGPELRTVRSAGPGTLRAIRVHLAEPTARGWRRSRRAEVRGSEADTLLVELGNAWREP